MLLVSNVRSLKEEYKVSRTKGKRQPFREAKNATANRLMVENALLEANYNLDADPEEENKDETRNNPIKFGAQKYGCPFCSKIMQIPYNMKRHILTHTGEKPFVCNDCGKSFNDKGNLSRHNLIHTGEKPFSCSFCDYSCIQKNVLQKHMKSIHSKK